MRISTSNSFLLLLVTTASLPQFVLSSSSSSFSATSSSSSKKNENKVIRFPLIPHSEIVNRRQRQRHLDGEDQNSDPLEVGELLQGYGTHYVDLWVGTPPQRQTVIVDTGSGVTAFPCETCKDCGNGYHSDAYFQESESSSFEKYTCDKCEWASCRNKGSDDDEYCHLSVSYQEGSMWNAYEGSDVTYIGGLHDRSINPESDNTEDGVRLHGAIHGEDPLDAPDFSFDMTFGCQTLITGLFKTQLADGIMGMCLKDSSIFNQMLKQKLINTPSFSLCFMRADDAAKDGSVAGALTMGGTDEKLHLAPMAYARGFRTKGVMHGVSIRKMWIMSSGQYDALDANSENTVQIDISHNDINSGSIIVDSGTTDTYMTRYLNAPFKKAFKQVTGFDYKENGMHLTDTQISELPTILIQLEGHPDNTDGSAEQLDSEFPSDVLVSIPPAHYIEYDSDSKKYVGRFSMTEYSGSVLGANTIRGHDVYFDIPENGRIGFAPSECDYEEFLGIDPEDEVESARKKAIDEDYYIDDEDDIYFFDPEADHPCDDACKKGIVGLGVVAAVALLIVVVYKRKASEQGYSKADLEGDHLNDLHLDTEIESIPAIA